MDEKLSQLPAQFLERVRKIVPQKYLSQVEESFLTKRPCTFRANTLKITADELSLNLVREGFELERVEWYADAFILKNRSQKELTETKWYMDGFLYLQSLSSMIPALLLNPQKDEMILDLTAAPGSKTTQIAAMMQNTGKIIANDRSFVRLEKLKANLKMQGVTNVEIKQMPGQILWQAYPEQFDRVLVDVPCSLEGRFTVLDPKSYRDWSLKKVKILTQTQKFLLRSAVSACKVGGTIVYSTCTLGPEENEAMMDWILKKESGVLEIISPNKTFPYSSGGLIEWMHNTYLPQIANSLRMYPSDTSEGFYVAVLRKKQSTIPTHFTPIAFDPRKHRR